MKKTITESVLKQGAKIPFDNTDYEGMIQLMEEYGDSEHAFTGETDYGEMIIISINPDNIVTEVFQDNGWVREEVYSIDPDIPGGIIRETSYHR